jgi:hypothetical protein
VSGRALMATGAALLIGAAGFLLGQQLGDGGSPPAETLPQQIETHDSRIPIPNLGPTPAFPELSRAAGRRTTRRAP